MTKLVHFSHSLMLNSSCRDMLLITVIAANVNDCVCYDTEQGTTELLLTIKLKVITTDSPDADKGGRHFVERIVLTESPTRRKPSRHTKKVLANHIIMTHHFNLNEFITPPFKTVHLTTPCTRHLYHYTTTHLKFARLVRSQLAVATRFSVT